ncbi:hypothetical protein ERUR111494_08940 [Erysipelothrix urinaevulpis]|uniref:hypothetical protein n=1 Tax=Erysipelothrix urinaevulpis TaxID=2683717 RepID=UPI001359BC3F|nr:hypothetical protein [Erysipelothrix urinaevulpis]
MAYLVLLLLTVLLIMFLPQLIYFAFMLWIVISVVRVLFPKRNTYQNQGRTYKTYEQPNQRQSQNTQNQSRGDIIDVEFTERDVEDQ